MKISKRLIKVAQMITPGGCVADIGTDHGYVPIYLVEHGLASHVIAMDINQGPLERARGNIRQKGLENKIELRLSDGFDKLKVGEAQKACIAGLGGELMIRLLKSGEKVVEGFEELVLSPHSEIALVREYIHEMGHRIVQEEMLFEEGKYYTILRTEPGREKAYTRMEYRYGKLLLERKDEIFMEYLKDRKHKTEKIIMNLQQGETKASMERKEELKEELEQLENILNNE